MTAMETELIQDVDDRHLCFKCRSIINGLENYVLHRKRNCQELLAEDTAPASQSVGNQSESKTSQASAAEANLHKTGGNVNSDTTLGYQNVITAPEEGGNVHKTGGNVTSDTTLGYQNVITDTTLCYENITTDSTSGCQNVTREVSGLGRDNDEGTCENADEAHNDTDEASLCATDFFQSLELQNSKQTCLAQTKLKDESTKELSVDDQNFFESIGLYWVNPADKPSDLMKLSQLKDEEEKSPDTVTDSSLVTEAQDFLQVLGLTPVGDVPGSKRWRLWNPDLPQEWTEDLLCPDLYLAESADNDPTLMEDQVHSVGTDATPSTTSQFHCCQCNRSLASADLLTRHLQSELHFKNTPLTETGGRDKRTVKKPKYLQDNWSQSQGKKTRLGVRSPRLAEDFRGEAEDGDNCQSVTTSSRVIVCLSCEARVLPHQYGKHLVSHYHYHRSLGHPLTQEVILSHIGEVVRQSPFQCGSCKFYCNWHSDLEQHVKEHTDKEGSSFWCQVCMKTITSHAQLEKHLRSYNHTELVTVINRSVPVIVKKIDLVNCEECGKSFRFNFSLRKHMKEYHKNDTFQLENQPKFTCGLCNFFTFKKSSLKAHEFLVHPNAKLKYDCYICKLQFANKESAIQHRNSARHKLNSANNSEESDEESETVNCNYCNLKFDKVELLMKHLEEDHYYLLPQCHLCGELFHFPQTISEHVKRKCESGSGIVKVEGVLKCDKCPFTSNKEDVKNLHDMYAHTSTVEDDARNCPICMKKIDSSKIKIHLKKHKKKQADMEIQNQSNTETFILNCDRCPYKTTKKILLNLHIKRQHRGDNNGRFSCQICSSTFKLKTSLNKHRKTHGDQQSQENAFNCDRENCSFVANYKSDLERHIAKHITDKNIVCSNCDFRCKRKSELVRHRKLVHDKIPFLTCAHCEYKTKNSCHMKRHTAKMHKVECLYNYMEVHLDENDVMVETLSFETPPEFVTEQVIEN